MSATHTRKDIQSQKKAENSRCHKNRKKEIPRCIQKTEFKDVKMVDEIQNTVNV